MSTTLTTEQFTQLAEAVVGDPIQPTSGSTGGWIETPMIARTTAVPHGLKQRLRKVMADVGYVQKNAFNAHHKYNYASADAVLRKINDSLCEHGITIIGTEYQIVHLSADAKMAVVKAELTLCDDEGNEATFTGLGQGGDSLDKATMKAMTAANKYAWAGACCISWGDDPEADADAPPQKESSSTTYWHDFVVARTNDAAACTTAVAVQALAKKIKHKLDTEKAPEPTLAELRKIVSDAMARFKE